MTWSSISAKDLERMLAQRDVDPIDLVIALYMYAARNHIPGAMEGMSKEEKELVQRIIRKTEDEEAKKHDHSKLQFW